MTPGIVRAAWLIPTLPLVGALALLFFGKRMVKAAGGFATTLVAGSFALSLWTLFNLIGRPSGARSFTRVLYPFIHAGRFKVNVDYRIDPLSVLMICVVTGVGMLIHLYSIGYMHGDERESRFFAYMNLFMFSMLVLVLANNFLLLYVGWELVGLSSYLLIGFWFERPSASTAAKKAFITNRVGDVGLALGIMLIFVHFGTLEFNKVFAASGGLSKGLATGIALLLFAGAAAKSAQIPLYVWLPDAMEGPTPVSALIHAATMVTAGVYLVARAHPIFDVAPTAQSVVAWIGLATALLGAFIAFTQDDIKRVLAYSTMSQLGFMFMALGVGAYTAAIFHLFTHAFFKALMFLGAGSVMHGNKDETDMTKMGGLRKAMPWTAGTFVIGWLAIVGFPGFSGFFSKDQILGGVNGNGRTFMLVLALIATFGTGFYMSRLVFLTFFGKSRAPADHVPHESSAVMVWPLALLAIAAAGAGWLGTSATHGGFQRFTASSVCESREESGATPDSPTAMTVPRGRCLAVFQGGRVHVQQSNESAGDFHQAVVPERQLGYIATGSGLAGVALAGFMYLGAFPWQRRRENPSLVWKASRNKFFVDDVYQFLFVGVGRAVAATAAFVVDKRVIDGAVNGFAESVGRLSLVTRKLQTGFVRNYALGVLGGVVAIAVFLLVRAS
ncbi:MAG: NADH-quinone oxidoreductase subunit L [Actinomycetota bacterium]